MSEEYGYKKLIVWHKSDDFAHFVYDLTLKFPKEELFGLTSQIRRSVLSVPANIVEGHSRNSKKEFHHFLSIAMGSLSEVGYFLDFSYKRGFIKEEDFTLACERKEEVERLLWKLYISQK